MLSLVFLLGFLSCGGGSHDLDRSKTLVSLTTAEQAQFCDELNAAQGGYGQSKTCPDGHIEDTDLNQSACVQAAPFVIQLCGTLTVGTFLDCASANASDLCAFQTAPACAPIRTCSGRT
jgi:hypothetical protein